MELIDRLGPDVKVPFLIPYLPWSLLRLGWAGSSRSRLLMRVTMIMTAWKRYLGLGTPIPLVLVSGSLLLLPLDSSLFSFLNLTALPFMERDKCLLGAWRPSNSYQLRRL